MSILSDQEARLARHHELREGEAIAGTVRRLPEHGAYNGNALVLALDDGELLAIPATAKRGASVLARELEQAQVRPGDRIEIAFLEWHTSPATGHVYRRFEVRRGGGAA